MEKVANVDIGRSLNRLDKVFYRYLIIWIIRNKENKNSMFVLIFKKKTMYGLDTVENLLNEASANLSTNRNHLISTTVKWD